MKKTWKKIKSAAGFTFLEVLISVVILGLIVSPFLGVFVTSARYTMHAQRVTAATYAGEHLLEELVGLDYGTLVASVYDQYHSGRQPYGNFYVDIDCSPSGAHGSLATGGCRYLHILFGPAGVLVVGPDGYSRTYAGVSSLTLSGSGLAIGTLETFPIPASGLPMIVILNNAASVGGGVVFTSSLAGTYVVRYTTTQRKDELTLIGVDEAHTVLYEGVDSYDTSIVRVTVSVYQEYADAEPLCVVEDYLRPSNWP